MLLYIMLLCYKSYQTIAGSMAQDNIQISNNQIYNKKSKHKHNFKKMQNISTK